MLRREKLFAKGVVAVSRSFVSSLSEVGLFAFLTIGSNVEISVSERGIALKSLSGVKVDGVVEVTVSRLGFTVFTGEKLILLPKVDPGILLFCLRKFDEVVEGAGAL